MARSSAKPVKGKKKKSGSVTVSMEGVESGGRTMPDGPAHAVVKEAELGESSAGNEMFTLKLEVTRGKLKATIFDHLVTTPNALWKLRSLLEAAGVEVPEGDMTITEEDLVDLEFDVEVTNEEYEGKDRPKITAYLPAGAAEELESEDDSDDEEEEEEEEDDDEEDDEEEEEEVKPKKKAPSKKRPVKDDEDDDEEEDDDDSDEDDEEEESDDEEEDEDDEEEDEEDDEDDAPKSKKKTSKKAKSKLRAGTKVAFEDEKGRAKKGVITSIDGDTVFVEDSKGVEWELEEDEIALV